MGVKTWISRTPGLSLKKNEATVNWDISYKSLFTNTFFSMDTVFFFSFSETKTSNLRVEQRNEASSKRGLRIDVFQIFANVTFSKAMFAHEHFSAKKMSRFVRRDMAPRGRQSLCFFNFPPIR